MALSLLRRISASRFRRRHFVCHEHHFISGQPAQRHYYSRPSTAIFSMQVALQSFYSRRLRRSLLLLAAESRCRRHAISRRSAAFQTLACQHHLSCRPCLVAPVFPAFCARRLYKSMRRHAFAPFHLSMHGFCAPPACLRSAPSALTLLKDEANIALTISLLPPIS